jgi:hypothetical protein
MCVQCMAGAATAAATATGLRAWAAVRFARHLTPRRKRAMTVVLLSAGVLAGGLVGPTP